MNLKLGAVYLPSPGLAAVSAPVSTDTGTSPAPVLPQTLPASGRSSPLEAPTVSLDQLEKAVVKIKHFLKATATNIQFIVDEQREKVVVRVIDSESNEVIRQIPSEEALAISQALDRMEGLLFRQDA